MTWAAALAAIVSILAAITAAREARSVTTLNHKVAALDRQAGQMRDDYRNLLKAIGDFKGRSNYGPILAAGEMLRAHPQTTGRFSSAIWRLTQQYHTGAIAGNLHMPQGWNDEEAIRNGFRESMADIERTRSALLR